MMRFWFWTYAIPILIEAPSWHSARAWARVFFGTTDLKYDAPPKKKARDVRLRWEGTDAQKSGDRKLLVSRRIEGVWSEWERAHL